MVETKRRTRGGAKLSDLLSRHVERDPSAPFLLTPHGPELSYRDMARLSAEALLALRRGGIGRNDRVAIAVADESSLGIATLLIAVNAVAVPLRTTVVADDVMRLCEQVRLRALLVYPGVDPALTDVARAHGLVLLEFMDDARAPYAIRTIGAPDPVEDELATPDSAALVLSTSGTDRPKFVELSHRNLCAAADAIAEVLALKPADRSVAVLPFAHIHGLSVLFASLASGGSVACLDGFSPAKFFAAVRAREGTWYTAAPAFHRALLEHAKRNPDVLSGTRLRFARSASAPLPEALAEELEAVLQVPVVEAYGMTEAAPQIASLGLDRGSRRRGSVGRAAGPDVGVLCPDGDVARSDAQGEVVVRGQNVAARYLGDAGAMDRACIDGWFRTGDLGRIDKDGFLFVSGRRDDVINRGGEKIAPRPIEEVLLRHPAVCDAAAFGVPHATLGEHVAAALVLAPGFEAEGDEAELHGPLTRAIRRFCRTRLRNAEVPQDLVVLTEVPRHGGKVRRRELPHLLERKLARGRQVGRGGTGREGIEETIREIWSQILGVEKVDRDTSFFSAGGDSISAAAVVARVNDVLHVDLLPSALFECPRLADLARRVEQARAPTGRARSVRESGDASPLSPAQRGLWFLDRMGVGSAYTMCAPLWLDGPLDVATLERALDDVRLRHDALRTVIEADVDGEPRQVVTAHSAVPLPVVDLTGLATSAREAEARRLATVERDHRFDLEQGPLFRATLLALGNRRHALLLSVHHIVSDLWSMGVLWRELRLAYEARLTGRASAAPSLSVQFRDVAAEQARACRTTAFEARLGFFTSRLRDAPPITTLPTDRPRPPEPDLRAETQRFVLPAETHDALVAVGAAHGATPFMTLLAAFQILLGRVGGSDDVVVGVPVANRTRLETEPLIGFLANTLAIRTRLGTRATFLDVLSRVRGTVAASFAHQDVPFERVVERLRPDRDPSVHPIFQVMFAYQSVPAADVGELGGGLVARPFMVDPVHAKFDATLYVTMDRGRLDAKWVYRTALFDGATVARVSRQFRALLDAVLAAPEQPIADLARLDDAPSCPAAVEWDFTATLLPSPSFPELFDAQVARTPAGVAVVSSAGRLTFAQLQLRVRRLARDLQARGVASGSLVGLALPRSDEMVVGVLAVLASGAAFLPLDPAYPPERLRVMLAEADASLVLTTSAAASRVEPVSDAIPVVRVDREQESIAERSDAPLETVPVAARPAYVIYTSGSSGSPKGVVVSHGSLANCAYAMAAALDVTDADRYLHTASFSFSSSVRQLVAPLCRGATLVVASRDEVRDPQALIQLIARERVTILDLVPSHWQALVEAVPELDGQLRERFLRGTLRLVCSASEPLPGALVRAWWGLGSTTSVLNMYGQTETAGIVAVHPVSDAEVDAERRIPVGRPVANTTLRVLDGALRPVPVGDEGDIWIGGDGVGIGYVNDPELTAQRFLAVSSGTGGATCYRTGDRGRLRADGTLELLGRADDQLKVRGFRVEPGEIEGALRQHPAIADAAVIRLPGRSAVGAVVVPAGVDRPDTPAVRAFLAKLLPEYMLPAQVGWIDRLPRTPTGKLDRAVLRSRFEAEAPGVGPANEGRHRPPETPDEHALAEIWRSLLRVDRVGLDDNYFDLGGDSLLSVRVVQSARAQGIEITLRQLFQFPTVGELAALAQEHRDSERASAARAARAARRVKPPRRFTPESLRALGREALVQAGLSPEGAAIVTEIQLESSLRGQPTHNVGDIPRYCRRLVSGVLNADPQIIVERESAISAQIDGDNGPGQWVAHRAIELAIEKAEAEGVGIVGARRSNHFGAAGHYAWMAAEAGLIGICLTNGPLILAPTGGVTPTFGNNPLAVGLPCASGHPVMLDIALSVAPRGKIGLAVAEGRPLEPGWILDRLGLPSTDLADLAAGLGVPIGAHKGSGLALVIEALAGGLTGAAVGREHAKGVERPDGLDLGHLFIVIDPRLFGSRDDFERRVADVVAQAKTSELAQGVDEIVVPGELELRERERSLALGVPLRQTTERALRKYAAKKGIRAPLVEVPRDSGSPA